MSRYGDVQGHSLNGDWLIGGIRRNPEALLLMAAGCVLLMRSGARSSSHGNAPTRYREHDAEEGSTGSWGGSSMRRGVSRAAEGASDYASDMKERVSDVAGSYAQSAADFAETARRAVSEQSDRWKRHAQSGFDSVLRNQPLAVAAAGLAAGAAVAAAFPATDLENRTLGGAREALTDAASKAGEAVMGAAGRASDRLTGEGLKGLAGEAINTITGGASSPTGAGTSGRSSR